MSILHDPRFTRLLAVLMLALVTAASHTVLTQDQTPRSGVVVEEVATGSAGEKAHIRPGDILTAWERPANPPANSEKAEGTIESAFDWMWVVLEQAPRGPVRVRGERDRKEITFELPVGNWGIQIRPRFDEHALRAFNEGKAALRAKDLERGARLWGTLAESADAGNDTTTASWIHMRLGDSWAEARRLPEALTAYESARGLAERSMNAIAQGFIWESIGSTLRRQNRFQEAEKAHQSAIAIRQLTSGESLSVALSLTNLGVVMRYLGALATAEAHYKRALAIRERLAPDSVELVANPLNNLGNVARTRGDLVTAEAYHKRALAIRERLAPDSLDVAASLNNLGNVAWSRGDLATAEAYHTRALAIKQKRAPDSLEVAISLNNLAEVALAGGQLTVADGFLKQALAITERRGPDVLLASFLNTLGNVALEYGDSAAAEGHFQRALAINEKLALDNVAVAQSLNHLGRVARDRGELKTAEAYFRRALAIREKLVPGSSDEAESQHDLALVHRKAGQHARAASHFLHAIDAVEAQLGKLGGTQEAQAGFSAQNASYYRDYIDLLIELNQHAEAFHVLERSRARALLAMLAERDLVFADDLPADLARQRTLMNADYDRTQAAIAALNPAKDAAEIDRLLGRLRDLRNEREEIVQTIRRSSPRFASLLYPQPLDLAGAQRSLDPGTVLLAYCVTREKTFLFALQPARPLTRAAPAVSVFTLNVDEGTLRDKVNAFRRLIQRGEESSQASDDALVAAGRELFETLVEPAAALIAASDRVVILPDGPLHTLPFAALTHRSDRAVRPARYLIEWKPLHVAASATVYAELKKTRQIRGRPPAALMLAAFGDPAYPPIAGERVDRIANPEVRAAARRGYSFEPLPATRREVEGIARLYGDRAASYVGDQATEDRAKAIGKSARYLHFASHGFLDERFPLNSALALTIPERPAEGQSNGLLQAWEIFEQMRIDADLVTLSACETGLGKELGGEGLVGLTRAFQYAGARTVMASLWSVGDESTATLMTRFYRHLKAGRAKDEALRAAQLEMLRTRGAAHPFQWAAFQLIGDWK